MEELSDADIKRFERIEMEGRDRAAEKGPIESDTKGDYRNSNIKTNGDRQWFENVHNAAGKMRRYFQDIGDEPWKRFAGEVATTAYEAAYGLSGCAISGLTRDECPAGKFADQINAMDNAARDIPEAKRLNISTGCTFNWKAFSPEKYNERRFLNDLTSCFHHNMTHAKLTARSWHKEGKCMWRE